jgi:hypothetical protein
MPLRFARTAYVVAACFPLTRFDALARDDSTNPETLTKSEPEMRAGPFDFHPRLGLGLNYDDNVLLSTANKQADVEWTIEPGMQAVAGDDAALIQYRDESASGPGLSPGNLVLSAPETWPGKVAILDYATGFQIFDRYAANNSIDQHASLSYLWPMAKLILGVAQGYDLQKMQIIEAGQRATVESIPTTFSIAYQLDSKISIEGDLKRLSSSYDATGLTGYTEYDSETWLNYEIVQNLNLGLGALAGWDDVTNNQDQTFAQLRVRARYNRTEKLAFEASVGGELREYENGTADRLRPVFEVGVEYPITARAWLRIGGFRQQYAAIFNGYNYATTAATIEFRQGITDRLTAELSLGFYSIDYAAILAPSESHTDGDYLARISVDARLAHFLNARVYYQFLNRQSGFNGDLADNQAGLQLALSF